MHFFPNLWASGSTIMSNSQKHAAAPVEGFSQVHAEENVYFPQWCLQLAKVQYILVATAQFPSPFVRFRVELSPLSYCSGSCGTREDSHGDFEYSKRCI